MKQIIILLIALVTVTAHSQEDRKNVKMVSERSVSTARITSVSGWEWKSSQWWHDGEPTESVPPGYSVIEEVREKYWLDSVEVKQHYRTTQEITVRYTTSSPGWMWREGVWYYYGKKVDTMPPSYEYTVKETKTTVDLDYDTGKEL